MEGSLVTALDSLLVDHRLLRSDHFFFGRAEVENDHQAAHSFFGRDPDLAIHTDLAVVARDLGIEQFDIAGLFGFLRREGQERAGYQKCRELTHSGWV